MLNITSHTFVGGDQYVQLNGSSSSPNSELLRTIFIVYLLNNGLLGVALNGVVIACSFLSPAVRGKDFAPYNNSVAVACLLAALARASVRLSLALSTDLGVMEAPICILAGFFSFFNMLVVILSLHPIFLHRYIVMCRAHWAYALSSRSLRAVLFGAPYACGILFGSSFLRLRVTDRGLGGLTCQMSRGEPSAVDGVLPLLLFAILASHFVLVVFYSSRVRAVLKVKEQLQLSRASAARVAETRWILRTAAVQAAAPLVLATPIFVNLALHLGGSPLFNRPDVNLFLGEFLNLTPVYNAAAVLILLKPYRVAVKSLCSRAPKTHAQAQKAW